MKLSKNYEKLEKSAVKLTVTVDKSEIEASYKKVTANYTKNAQIPGFRKGHVPASVLERKYGDALKADTLSEVIDASLNEIFSDENEKDNRPLPYAQPQLEKLPELDITKDLTYSVTYDVLPKVEIKNFSGINVKEPQVTVGDAELAEEPERKLRAEDLDFWDMYPVEGAESADTASDSTEESTKKKSSYEEKAEKVVRAITNKISKNVCQIGVKPLND